MRSFFAKNANFFYNVHLARSRERDRRRPRHSYSYSFGFQACSVFDGLAPHPDMFDANATAAAGWDAGSGGYGGYWCTASMLEVRAWCEARTNAPLAQHSAPGGHLAGGPCVGFGRRRSGCYTAFTFLPASLYPAALRPTGVPLADFPEHLEILRAPTESE